MRIVEGNVVAKEEERQHTWTRRFGETAALQLR